MVSLYVLAFCRVMIGSVFVQRAGSQALIMVTHDPQLTALAGRRIQLEQLGRADERA